MAVIGDDNISWYGISYGNGKYVVVGSDSVGNGFSTSSTDGENWSIPKTQNNSLWRGIAYGNGKFVAISTQGAQGSKSMFSTDGENWSEPITVDSPEGFQRIRFGNKTFIAVGGGSFPNGSPVIISKNDGQTWSEPEYLGGQFPIINDIIYGIGTGKFVLIGTRIGKNFSMTSSDGLSWSEPVQFLGNGEANCMGFGNRKFVVGTSESEIITSTDGMNWTIQSTIQGNMSIQSIANSDSEFIALLRQTSTRSSWVSSSTDLINWSEPQQISNKILNDIVMMPY